MREVIVDIIRSIGSLIIGLPIILPIFLMVGVFAGPLFYFDVHAEECRKCSANASWLVIGLHYVIFPAIVMAFCGWLQFMLVTDWMPAWVNPAFN